MSRLHNQRVTEPAAPAAAPARPNTRGIRVFGTGRRLMYPGAMLTLFGSIAVSIMVLAYALEPRSVWFIGIFAAASAATAVYSGLAEVYPIMVVEAIWAGIALLRFQRARRGTARLVTSQTGGAAGEE